MSARELSTANRRIKELKTELQKYEDHIRLLEKQNQQMEEMLRIYGQEEWIARTKVEELFSTDHNKNVELEKFREMKLHIVRFEVEARKAMESIETFLKGTENIITGTDDQNTNPAKLDQRKRRQENVN